MKRVMATLLILAGLLLAGAPGSLAAQTGSAAFAAPVLAAKTIAIVNDTHAGAVEEGAADALRSWGQFTLVDDPETADVTLRFDKSTEHQGKDSQKTDSDGKPTDYSYSMSFSSSIHMKAYLKDADAPFFTTKTDDSKKKAGMSCVNDFHSAYRAARQH